MTLKKPSKQAGLAGFLKETGTLLQLVALRKKIGSISLIPSALGFQSESIFQTRITRKAA